MFCLVLFCFVLFRFVSFRFVFVSFFLQSSSSAIFSETQACARPPDVRMLRGLADVKALYIPRHRDVKLNELPKQILMLLPLLLLLLLLLYVYIT